MLLGNSFGIPIAWQKLPVLCDTHVLYIMAAETLREGQVRGELCLKQR